MPRPSSQLPDFTPGTRLSRLPVRSGQESLEDFYRDLFVGSGPEHDRQRLFRLLDEDVTDGAAAKGRAQALDHLDQAFRRIDAWTSQGDFLPVADRAELKRRVAHNLLAVRPGLPLLAPDDAHTATESALLRQVETEHAAWRQGWTIGPENAPYGRRPQAESPGPRRPWDQQPDSGQPRRPWDEQAPRQAQEMADALRRRGHDAPLPPAAGPDRDEPRQQDLKKTYWVVIPEPTACERCLALAGKVYAEQPERPHPNCKCEIESRAMTAREVRAFLDAQASRAQAIRAERERLEREKQAARIKDRTPAYVDSSQWNQDGDPVTVRGKDKNGRPVHRTFKGVVLPDKTPGGVAIKIKNDKQIDRRVTKEMSDTLQEVLDDPRCKEAGITEVTISSTTDGQHTKPDDRHYDGKAVDIAQINGKAIANDPTAKMQSEVMQKVIEEKAKELGIKDNLGPGALDIYDSNGRIIDQKNKPAAHNGHLHIAIH